RVHTLEEVEMTKLMMLLLMVVLVGCADDAPVRATYVPGDCPPCETTPTGAEAPIELGESAGEVVDSPDTVAGDDEVTDGVTESQPAVATASGGGKVNLNEGSTLELTRLPGVGPALAARIAEYRDKRPFDKIEDLQRVRG